MPMPMEYQRATDHFRNFLSDAQKEANLSSPHQTYTMTQAVFQVFRRRLDLKNAIQFANLLPVCLRALFVADWDPEEPRKPFSDRETMITEVQSLRANHNFSPNNSISAVYRALKKHIDPATLNQFFSQLDEDSVQFWES